MNDNDPLAWVCSCGCQSFRLLSNGIAECCNCENSIGPNGPNEWRNILPPEKPTNKTDANTIIIKYVGSDEFAQKKVLQNINKWIKNKEIAFIFAYKIDGSGTHWLYMTNKEEKNWIINKIKGLLYTIRKANV